VTTRQEPEYFKTNVWCRISSRTTGIYRHMEVPIFWAIQYVTFEVDLNISTFLRQRCIAKEEFPQTSSIQIRKF